MGWEKLQGTTYSLKGRGTRAGVSSHKDGLLQHRDGVFSPVDGRWSNNDTIILFGLLICSIAGKSVFQISSLQVSSTRSIDQGVSPLA